LSGFVLDASVALAWCFDDESTPAAWALLDRLRHAPAHVPALWALEIGNILLGAERRKRITQARSTEFVGILGELDIQVDRESIATTASAASISGTNSRRSMAPLACR
jgi:predicted nucleic acid-binding protein